MHSQAEPSARAPDIRGMRPCLRTILLPMLVLTGCASQVPESIRVAPGESLSVHQVQQDPAGTRGRVVRWGGEILSLGNRRDHSDVVVLRRPLFNDGEPKPSGGEARRFVARLPGFVDPADFLPGQRLTVRGRLEGVSTRMVGEYPYPHPVVRASVYHRWDKYVEPPLPRWYHDPFYCDPVWPWGHPYYRPGCW